MPASYDVRSCLKADLLGACLIEERIAQASCRNVYVVSEPCWLRLNWLVRCYPLHPNVLAAALANKLARIAWTVLAQQRGYEARITKAVA